MSCPTDFFANGTSPIRFARSPAFTEEADVDAEAVGLDELALRPLEVRPATIVCLER